MAFTGNFALLLAFALSVYCFGAGLLALLTPDEPNSQRLSETARRAGVVVFGAVLLAAVALVVSAFRDDFSIAYIFHHSNRDLPGPYKFATLWSGQEGSLLFWSLLLSGYGFVLRLRYKTDPRLFAYASVILAAVQVFFFALVNFAANPFGLLEGPMRADGSGLNPLLQYPEMVIHPPMLYLGYVGFTIPFAFALGALIMKSPGKKWIHIPRRWTMVTWGFLTVGIFLGAHWAYAVLGWGGYWGWDPVENASLMPWLVGTAFLHSVMVQEKRGMLKVWNVSLVCATFALALLGTFLVRSGILNSIHAFGASTIGVQMLVFIGCVVALSAALIVWRLPDLRSEARLDSLLSREAFFLLNNLMLVGLCLVIMWGTFFPLISEAITGHESSVGPPWFDRLTTPLAIVLVLLAGIGPVLAWRRVTPSALVRMLRFPVGFTLLTLIALLSLTTASKSVPSLLMFCFVAFVLSAVGQEFWRGARA